MPTAKNLTPVDKAGFGVVEHEDGRKLLVFFFVPKGGGEEVAIPIADDRGRANGVLAAVQRLRDSIWPTRPLLHPPPTDKDTN
jgi:hypothetical protein